MKKINICYVVTVEFAAINFLKNHIFFLNNSGAFNVTLIVNTPNKAVLEEILPNITIIHTNIKRKPNFFNDLITIFFLYNTFKKNNFDIIHSLMPKSGLLTMLTSKMSKCKVRLHTFTGQVWVDSPFLSKTFFKYLDKLIANYSTFNLTDSHSQMQFLIDENIVDKNKISVIGKGSICGYDVGKFVVSLDQRLSLRNKLGISADDVVYIYLGRLNVKKGVLLLFDAFLNLSFKYSNIKLIYVGPDENDIQSNIVSRINNMNISKSIFFFENTINPQVFLNISDVLCIPSFREGFGSVVIEAGAMNIPSIGSNIYGLSDSIINNKTGLLFEKGNMTDLSIKMELLLNLPNYRKWLGINAHEFSKKNFTNEIISSKLTEFYKSIYSC
jgi:glycosyltransferase involved in cell wall biosynthesis